MILVLEDKVGPAQVVNDWGKIKMIITTWINVEYSVPNTKEPMCMAFVAPKPSWKAFSTEKQESVNLPSSSKWKFISSSFDSENKIMYYHWELIENEKS